ncbi:DMT family transporter [Desulfovibrio inopinatus]|uniref:DMT family transporter n=1 Tax=Desulfovibrio inopinatus TaxID=102109 RepID=UPI000428C432|nr:DMT family transporter [Desulfovibrio inopinatus]
MKSNALRADILLFITAAIWGVAFVAQRVGMDNVGPFTFNGVRFALGGLVLLPLALKRSNLPPLPHTLEKKRISLWLASILAGVFLFGGASLQQVGLLYTTAGKAGFITGLYVVLVPIGAFIFSKAKPGPGAVAGAGLAALGLYFLSMNESFSLAFGDLLELMCAVLFAGHVLIIGRLAPMVDPLRLAVGQYMVCALLNLLVAGCVEPLASQDILAAAIPIAYGGIMSVGIAYTLQVVAQQHAKESHAAIILSLESVFAALAGAIILHESLGLRELLGCSLMFAGFLVSQLWIKRNEAQT